MTKTTTKTLAAMAGAFALLMTSAAEAKDFLVTGVKPDATPATCSTSSTC